MQQTEHARRAGQAAAACERCRCGAKRRPATLHRRVDRPRTVAALDNRPSGARRCGTQAGKCARATAEHTRDADGGAADD